MRVPRGRATSNCAMDEQEAPRAHTTESMYGRVTNPARFAMLHSVALELLNRLHGEFDVERVEPYTNDEGFGRLTRVPLARPTTALVPRDRGCAPLLVAFSSFPGLLVRVGRCSTLAFPACGCDACDEGAEDEAERFQRVVHAVTTGHFRESVKQGVDGSSIVVCEWESAGQHWREQRWLEPASASNPELNSIPHWKPWIGR
jgi:hypothetical protein